MASSVERPLPTVVYLATGNAHKAREMAAFAHATAGPAGTPFFEIVMPPQMPAVTEDAASFVGNARKKAAALKAILPPEAWVLADDSGLCVDALDGAPGVESAYFAGPAGDGAANLRKLVKVMRDVPVTGRGAHFRCVLVLRSGPGEAEAVFEGQCPGTLLFEPAGGNGFGYDPLFVPAGHTKSFAELAEEEKNLISHRAQAWRTLAAWLRSR